MRKMFHQKDTILDLNYNQTYNEDMLLGITSLEEADCYMEFLSKPYPTQALHCNATWDGLSCWPTTPAGGLASIPCFAQFNGVKYDINSNASRLCFRNASWSPWSNYRSCKPLSLEENELLQDEFDFADGPVHIISTSVSENTKSDLEGLWDTKEAATIYYVGYGISLIALSLALMVFLRFKDLRCLRNTIHTNLMVTYLLIDVTWILTATLQSNPNTAAAKVACFLIILLTYLMATNFFWMLVEGLYLYMLVVKTFSIENVPYHIYVLIGWGIPALVATAWAIAKAIAGASDEPFAQRGCPWQNKDYYDYVFSCPVMLVLLVNIFFLCKIMWVLITKLRASNSLESKQYWKAAKALLVLIPLLGVTYIIVIATPSNPVAEVVFIYIQATLLSIQGFIVAVLYCFLNGEVQNSIRTHFERWRTRKTVGKISRQSTFHKSSRLNSRRSTRDTCTSHITIGSDNGTAMNDVKCLAVGAQNVSSVRGHML